MSETCRMIVVPLTLAALLATGCGVPPLLASKVHPSLGSATAILAAILWARLVRPGPGYLQGLISVWGLAAILGALLACLLIWIR